MQPNLKLLLPVLCGAAGLAAGLSVAHIESVNLPLLLAMIIILTVLGLTIPFRPR